MKRAAIALALIGCHARASVTTCADDLGGEWRVESGSATWVLADDGARVEGYPMFPDAIAGSTPGVRAAPRGLGFARDGSATSGEVSRRFERGARICTAKAALHVLACRDDTLEIIFADPAEPAFIGDDAEPKCVVPHAGPSRRERWHRIR